MFFRTVEQFLPVENDTMWSLIVFPVLKTAAPSKPIAWGKGKNEGAVAAVDVQPETPTTVAIRIAGIKRFCFILASHQ
jgi:hypothetical protein